MPHIVLGIGYQSNEQEDVRNEWKKYNVDFRFADSTANAVLALQQEDFICVTVCSKHLNVGQIEILRNINPVPIVVLSPDAPAAVRARFFHHGVAEFIVNTNLLGSREDITDDARKVSLENTEKADDSLTIMEFNDLYCCLEHRTVEVRGRKIHVTGKEFEVLALLMSHPKRVYTYEMIMELVWNENFEYYARKTLINHIGNLRRKLKIDKDIPNYIFNVHAVGYKFDPDAK